jgi:hypothetical protein
MCTSHHAWMAAAINGQAAIRAISPPRRMLLAHGLMSALVAQYGPHVADLRLSDTPSISYCRRRIVGTHSRRHPVIAAATVEPLSSLVLCRAWAEAREKSPCGSAWASAKRPSCMHDGRCHTESLNLSQLVIEPRGKCGWAHACSTYVRPGLYITLSPSPDRLSGPLARQDRANPNRAYGCRRRPFVDRR